MSDNRSMALLLSCCISLLIADRATVSDAIDWSLTRNTLPQDISEGVWRIGPNRRQLDGFNPPRTGRADGHQILSGLGVFKRGRHRRLHHVASPQVSLGFRQPGRQGRWLWKLGPRRRGLPTRVERSGIRRPATAEGAVKASGEKTKC